MASITNVQAVCTLNVKGDEIQYLSTKNELTPEELEQIALGNDVPLELANKVINLLEGMPPISEPYPEQGPEPIAELAASTAVAEQATESVTEPAATTPIASAAPPAEVEPAAPTDAQAKPAAELPVAPLEPIGHA